MCPGELIAGDWFVSMVIALKSITTGTWLNACHPIFRPRLLDWSIIVLIDWCISIYSMSDWLVGELIWWCEWLIDWLNLTDQTIEFLINYVSHLIFKSLSHECRISLRMRKECHFFASLDVCWNAIHVCFMDVHHPVMCVVCTCYFSPLSTSFVSNTLKVIHSSYVSLCSTHVTGPLLCENSFCPVYSDHQCDIIVTIL